MGTRAVIRVGQGIRIATHWDGNPDSLGKDLATRIPAAVKRRVEEIKVSEDIVRHQEVVKTTWCVAAEHSIDFATTAGEANFRKIYDDFAEYEYEVSPTDMSVRGRACGRTDQDPERKCSPWRDVKTEAKRIEKGV